MLSTKDGTTKPPFDCQQKRQQRCSERVGAGNLLLVHGTGDDNWHYQGVEALVNEFIRHGRQFRMMSYPNRSHSISEGANTTLHLRELMTSFLHEKLPAGAR